MTRTVLVLAMLACQGDDPTSTDPSDPPVDSDSGTTTPMDTDTGTSSTGTTADTSDTDTGTIATDEWLFDETRVLVVPDADGLHFMANDGTLALSRTWTELMGPCEECGGEGASADGDGILVSFTTGEGIEQGAIARLDANLALDFRLQGFVFPHDAVRDPIDDTIIIPEATANKITWVAGDGASTSTVRVLDGSTYGWYGGIPNGIDRFEHDGRSLLMCSHRGGGGFPPGFGLGEITLWDISVADAPELVWRFPFDGALDMPHGPLFRRFADQWWLVYAHSGGGLEGSTVGLAVTDDPTVLPAYVADLVPIEPLAPFIFLRGVELTSDGWLYLTDSGGRSGSSTGIHDGRVLKAPMPILSPTGLSGATGPGQQLFVELVDAEVLLEGLDNPFEGWLWTPTVPLESL
jgi:hypothetical protein